ncbi:MAG TPA: hypothetical protein VH044_13195 [Polyangiaceae bacterium]|nr:hypothetical protein [Polyangiaceae bacterium]
MKTMRSVPGSWGACLVAGALACLAMSALPGCELIVDFDRSKIPGDASVPVFDSGSGDDGGDAATDGGTPNDATVTDATPDGESPDATDDGGPDSTAPDASDGATPDASDAGTVEDTGVDAPAEAATIIDSGADASDGT